MKKFRQFQLVKMKLVHDEKILKRLDEIKGKQDLVIKNEEFLYFVKPRPALVIKGFKPKQHGENKYLVIPITSQRSIAHWYGAEYPLRVRINNVALKKPRSFLMLDNLRMLSESCLKPLIDEEGLEVFITDNDRDVLKFQINEKLGNLVP